MLNPVKLARTAKEIRMVSRHFKTTFLFALIRALKFHNKALFSLEDIVFWGLTDPRIPESEIPNYVSREARVRIERKYNNKSEGLLVDNKVLFYEHCEKYNLPHPGVVGIFESDTVGKDQMAQHRSEWMKRFADLRGERLIFKPALGMKGQGIILAVISDDGESLSIGGKSKGLHEFYGELIELASRDMIVIQLQLSSEMALSELSGTSAVQCLRFVSFISESGNCELLFCRLKIIVGDHHVDNFASGTTGNLIADVDLDTGRILSVWSKDPDKIGLDPVTRHPLTGYSFENFEVPLFDEAKELVRRAAYSLPSLRALGWDVALTPKGPILIEANQEWETFPIAPSRCPISGCDWKALGSQPAQ